MRRLLIMWIVCFVILRATGLDVYVAHLGAHHPMWFGGIVGTLIALVFFTGIREI